MKTQRQQVQEILDREFYGHPSREDEEKIRRLEEIVLLLATEIDRLKNKSHHE